jgi:hypothetical protein
VILVLTPTHTCLRVRLVGVVVQVFSCVPGPSMSLGDIDPPYPYMNVTNPFSSWMICGGALDPSTSAPCPFMSCGDY